MVGVLVRVGLVSSYEIEIDPMSFLYMLGNSLTDWYKRPTPIWRRRCETTARTSH